MIKKRLLSLLVLLVAVVTGAVAQGPWTSGACTVTLSDGVMTVSGTGAMEDYESYNDILWDAYLSDIETIVIESGVTSIGRYAFTNCNNLKSVSIPASVTSIGTYAFQECGRDADALTVSIAEGSTPLTIGESAFVYANLKSIDIPNRVTSIGISTFSGCSKLESVSIPASVTSIDNYAFESCGSDATALTVSFAEGSTPLTIGENAFCESNLKSIDINRVTSIGVGAFVNCTHLESVSIPASVTSIGIYAFSYCSNLAKVYIYAPSLTTYGTNAFAGNAAGRKIYVLPTAVDTYKNGWPAYAADIEAMTVYATSVKEGTEDAANWSATPSQAAEGQTVTINYAGTKSVKSVTAKRKATTGNITVYFTDAQNYGDVHVYYWNDGPAWPGTAMTYVETNEYSQKVYRAEIPTTAVGIIFNGNGNQTVDITENIADGSWWYTTDQFDGSKNEVGYVGKYTIEVTNVDDNKWTFTQPDGNVELDIEYYPAHPVTINAGDEETTNWSATPTEQSVGQNVTLQYTGRKKIKRITIVAAPTGPTAYTLAESTVGMIVGTDGKAYAVEDKDNLPTGVTAVAMVAYKSGSNGLAIQLNDDPVKMNWADAKTNAEGLTAVSGGTWRLPSKDDWQNMFVGCAVSGDATVPDVNNEMDPIAGFKAKIAATGITWKSSNYWSSTESSSPLAWLVRVKLDDGDAVAAFSQSPTFLTMAVLGCLAF